MGKLIKTWQLVNGVLIEGYGVASGTSPSSPYPVGSVVAQIPFFKQRGLDLTGLHAATLNVSIAPARFELVRPGYTFRDVKWIENFPAEDFSFSPCRVIYAGQTYDGYVYYPHPETKQRHHHDRSTLEIITRYIDGLSNGSSLQLQLDPAEIWVQAASEEGDAEPPPGGPAREGPHGRG